MTCRQRRRRHAIWRGSVMSILFWPFLCFAISLGGLITQ